MHRGGWAKNWIKGCSPKVSIFPGFSVPRWFSISLGNPLRNWPSLTRLVIAPERYLRSIFASLVTIRLPTFQAKKRGSMGLRAARYLRGVFRAISSFGPWTFSVCLGKSMNPWERSLVLFVCWFALRGYGLWGNLIPLLIQEFGWDLKMKVYKNVRFIFDILTRKWRCFWSLTSSKWRSRRYKLEIYRIDPVHLM